MSGNQRYSGNPHDAQSGPPEGAAPKDTKDSSSRTKSDWRAILSSLGVQPSKALGQNFLHDPAIVKRIADAADVDSNTLVVEIGPGLGVLTRELAARAGRVVAVELDRRLAEYVRSLLLPHTNVIEADILNVEMRGLTHGHPYVVVANLPYSIASAAIAHLLESDSRPIRLIVMVQREVAERVTAGPPRMSILSVAVQFFGRPRILFRIGPGAFVPAPKVDSAVLEIDVAEQSRLDVPERERFFHMVRAGFSQKRKQLANSLAAALSLEKSSVIASLTAAKIDPRRRAETLSIDDWLRLLDTLPRGDLHV